MPKRSRDGRPSRSRRQQMSLAGTGIGLYVVRIGGRFAGYCGLLVGRAGVAEPEIAYELLRVDQGKGDFGETVWYTIELRRRSAERHVLSPYSVYDGAAGA